VTHPDPVEFPTVSGPALHHDPALDTWRREEPVRPIRLAYGRWCWIVTRYNDVKLVLTDPRFSRRAAARDDAPRKTAGVVQKGSLASMDGPDHLRLRRLVTRALTARSVEALRPHTREVVDGFLDEMAAAAPPVDLVANLALPVPIAVICELLGVPYSDRTRFRGWADSILTTAPVDDGAASLNETARNQLFTYLAELIDQRRRQPGDDLLARLVAVRDEDDALTEAELLQLSFTLLGGGFETTATMIAKGALVLLTNPDQVAILRAKPELWPDAVDEVLRFVPLGAGNALPLEAVEDVQLSGVTIRAGDYVMTSPAAANFDDAVFGDPERFDVERAGETHFSLGYGPHYCIGANLARMELQVVLQTFFERFPGVRLAVEPGDLVWRDSTAMWALESLPVVLGPAR
jgi:cytochrome P450